MTIKMIFLDNIPHLLENIKNLKSLQRVSEIIPHYEVLLTNLKFNGIASFSTFVTFDKLR